MTPSVTATPAVPINTIDTKAMLRQQYEVKSDATGSEAKQLGMPLASFPDCVHGASAGQ